MPYLKTCIGLRLSGICTLKIILGGVGYPGGPDLVFLGQLAHVDHLVQHSLRNAGK